MSEPIFSYGGQAVIEGVMMRGRRSLAIATRQGAEDISVGGWDVETAKNRPAFLRWPFIRGTVNLVDSLVVGVKTLVYSANQMLDDGEEEESLSNTEIAVTVAIALGLGIVLFILMPAFLAQVIKSWAPGRGLQNVLEGMMRIVIFILYIMGISQVKDVQRVFQYHGAEHKTIFAYEAGVPLTVENASIMSRLHPRCGTSFLLLVMVVSILLYSLLPPLTMVQRLLSRLILLPVIAGIAYEIIKLAGKKLDNPVVAAISWPGMQLQRLTTKEPDDSQLEVAIAALTKVLQDDGILPISDTAEIIGDSVVEAGLQGVAEPAQDEEASEP
ncbi:MAG: DUF1385 domain-containing protein [Clostridiales bacterium]|nr:DUF1385 domain-containing protein [Clostridiales bacterium]